MKTVRAMNLLMIAFSLLAMALTEPASAQIGRRFPSEKKAVSGENKIRPESPGVKEAWKPDNCGRRRQWRLCSPL
jgi:hypothetical protein